MEYERRLRGFVRVQAERKGGGKCIIEILVDSTKLVRIDLCKEMSV